MTLRWAGGREKPVATGPATADDRTPPGPAGRGKPVTTGPATADDRTPPGPEGRRQPVATGPATKNPTPPGPGRPGKPVTTGPTTTNDQTPPGPQRREKPAVTGPTKTNDQTRPGPGRPEKPVATGLTTNNPALRGPQRREKAAVTGPAAMNVPTPRGPEEREQLTCRPRGAPRRAVAGGAAALLALAALTACSATDPADSGSSSAAASAPTVSGTVTVFAAASLKETFTALGQRFETAHPDTKVTFSFGGSDSLAASITGGAPADVFAAADPRTMKRVTDAGDTAGSATTFVRNQLEIATAPGNPEHITALRDLTGPGLKVALCAPAVPCGATARKALSAGGLRVTPVSYEQDVKSALTKVELKEVDAALVYRTDVRAAGGRVGGVDFPESATAVNSYPIAVLKDAPNAAAARAFVALVTSAEGRKVLGDAGFLTP